MYLVVRSIASSVLLPPSYCLRSTASVLLPLCSPPSTCCLWHLAAAFLIPRSTDSYNCLVLLYYSFYCLSYCIVLLPCCLVFLGASFYCPFAAFYCLVIPFSCLLPLVFCLVQFASCLLSLCFYLLCLVIQVIATHINAVRYLLYLFEVFFNHDLWLVEDSWTVLC